MVRLGKVVFFAVCVLALPASSALAHQHHREDATLDPARAFAKSHAALWALEAMCIKAVKAQNLRYDGITQAEIDAMDLRWRLETVRHRRPLIDQVMSNTLSRHLAALKDSMKGAVTEIVVIDRRGLNVAASDIDSDFWQGDEEKWQKTVPAGPSSVYVGPVELDTSTDLFQSEVSLPITDPETGEVIGALTMGVDLDRLATAQRQSARKP